MNIANSLLNASSGKIACTSTILSLSHLYPKKQAFDNPLKFWESYANSEIDWFKPFQTVLDSENSPFFKWFKEKYSWKAFCVIFNNSTKYWVKLFWNK